MKDPESIPSCSKFTHTYTCAGGSTHSHTYKQRCTLTCTLLCIFDQSGRIMTLKVPHTHTMYVLPDYLAQAHTHIHRTISFPHENPATTHKRWGQCVSPDTPSPPHPIHTHTHTHSEKQGLHVTWCCSCCLPLIPACISPAGWRQSDAQPQVPWSGVQTEAPEEIEKDKVCVRLSKRGSRRELRLWWEAPRYESLELMLKCLDSRLDLRYQN